MLKFCGSSERPVELRSFYLAKYSSRITDTKRTRSTSNAKGAQDIETIIGHLKSDYRIV